MQREGYWINSHTGVWFEIDEHAQWIGRRGNADLIGLPSDLYQRLVDLHWERDRLEILLTAMAGGLIRVRDHGPYIAVEYTCEDKTALRTVAAFLEASGQAGPFSLLYICNLRMMHGLSLNYQAFCALSPGYSPSFSSVKLNYSQDEAAACIRTLDSLNNEMEIQ